MNATLTLAPDEVLPNTPAPLTGEAFGPVTLPLLGKKRQFWYRPLCIIPEKHIIFVTEVGREGAGNWVVCDRHNLTPTELVGMNLSAESKQILLSWNRQDYALGRLFYLRRKGKRSLGRVILGEDGFGAWLNNHLSGHEEMQFDFTLDAAVFRDNRMGIAEWLEQERADFNSDLSFAGRWKRTNRDEEREELVYGQHLVELERAMRWALMYQLLVWEEDDDWTWNLATPHKYPAFDLRLWQGNLSAGSSDARWFSEEELSEKSPLLSKLNRFVIENYFPEITAPVRAKHRSVRMVLEERGFSLEVTVGEPTAHERIEAALQLRAWLQQNNAPPEIEALLPN